MSSVQFPTSVAPASTVAPVGSVSSTSASSGNSTGNNARTAAGAQLAGDAALLGAKGLGSAAVAAASAPTLTSAAHQLAASWPTAAAPNAPAALAVSAAPIPVLPQAPQAPQTHISAQAREALSAGFDPRGAAHASAPTSPANTNNPAATGLSGGAHQAAPVTAAWPALGLDTPLRHMVQSLVQQVTTQGGGHAGQQRVVAAQIWPLSLAHALESGGEDGEGSPMQTWLVRQGTVQTAEGPRGLTLTLRVPMPWLASLAAQAAPVALGSAKAASSTSALQATYLGAPQNLQSGVLALVLQGMGSAGPAVPARTSALLVLDFQPLLMTAGAAVYGRDLLQARHDPWVQQAQLQVSGQWAKDEEIARQREREAGLCQASGCPYALRAPCAQPFCLEMRVGTPLAAPMAALDVIAGRAGTTGSVTPL